MRAYVPILSSLQPKTAARLRRKLVPAAGGCLEFTGYRNARGYGLIEVTSAGGAERFPILTHRLAWALENGIEPPADKIICHTCHNPSCCNPEHLYLGTHQSNSDDMLRAGRQRSGKPMLGRKGVNHPMSKYPQAKRDEVIRLRRASTPWRDIVAQTGVKYGSCDRWWKEWLATT